MTRFAKYLKWGEDDLDLPFNPRRHHDIWTIRQRTFRKFESIVARIPRGIALDVGAGNCWMTRYLDRWGFGAIAADFNDSPADGLRAGQNPQHWGALPPHSRRNSTIALSFRSHYTGRR